MTHFVGLTEDTSDTVQAYGDSRCRTSLHVCRSRERIAGPIVSLDFPRNPPKNAPAAAITARTDDRCDGTVFLSRHRDEHR